jgi:sodium-dependent dicarboxylate transporter 2/3/5
MEENKEKKEKIDYSKLKDIISILLAFGILFIFYFLPTPGGLTHSGQMMIGILVMAAILWITEPIPLPVTGLLIMILQPILGVMRPADVFSSFGNQAVFFLIGAFIIAAAIEKHGLHRRIALRFLSKFDKNPRFFSLGIMLSCASLSFVMPEHGVAALFLPIIASILIAMKVIPKQSNFGKISMLSIAYGCSIGSLGTLVGGARNPLTVAILSQEAGIELSFIDWMIYAMPVVIISLPLVWLVLQFTFPIELKEITDAKNEIKKQVKIAGRISNKEILVLSILILTVLMWIFLSHNVYFGLAVIAVFGAFLLFLTGCVKWKDVEKRVPWGIILLYGGAITLGIGIQTTGAGAWIADQVLLTGGQNIFIVIIVMILFTVLLTNIMSNIGAVALLLPIGLAIAPQIGVSPVFTSMIIALSGGLAFMLVIATPGNAITYSSGYFSTKDLFKAGVLANIICIAVVFIIAVLYWIGILGLHNL